MEGRGGRKQKRTEQKELGKTFKLKNKNLASLRVVAKERFSREGIRRSVQPDFRGMILVSQLLCYDNIAC